MIIPNQVVDAHSVAQHYDELDVFYRRMWGEHVHHGLWLSNKESNQEAVLQLVKRVAERAGIRSESAVCDVGSGYGATSRHLAREYGAKVTAITLSPSQYAYARSIDPDGSNPTYLLGDWLENTLPAESFDAVVAIESTEHIADKARCFAEAQRVLRPGGRVVVCAWLACERPSDREVRFLLEPICRESKLEGMGSEGDYRELLEGAGLTVESFEDVTRQVRRTWPACLGSAVRHLVTDADYREYFANPKNDNRDFAFGALRIWLSYWTQTMRYGIFTARRPSK